MKSIFVARFFNPLWLVGIVLIVCCGGCESRYERAQRSSSVASDFVRSLVGNDYNDAIALSAPGLHGDLGAWMAERDVFRCTTPWWEFDHRMTQVFLESESDQTERTTYSGQYLCVTNNSVYIFRIGKIDLVETQEGWQVESFSNICEAHDYESCDPNQ